MRSGDLRVDEEASKADQLVPVNLELVNIATACSCYAKWRAHLTRMARLTSKERDGKNVESSKAY